mmetsp:Transcript_32144/g.69433  ORF Transcript_32144/g.69433 Transcript_32144/m.69433 type:complete len:238 (+) Transcript_32144:906-1619(+)
MCRTPPHSSTGDVRSFRRSDSVLLWREMRHRDSSSHPSSLKDLLRVLVTSSSPPVARSSPLTAYPFRTSLCWRSPLSSKDHWAPPPNSRFCGRERRRRALSTWSVFPSAPRDESPQWTSAPSLPPPRPWLSNWSVPPRNSLRPTPRNIAKRSWHKPPPKKCLRCDTSRRRRARSSIACALRMHSSGRRTAWRTWHRPTSCGCSRTRCSVLSLRTRPFVVSWTLPRRVEANTGPCWTA